MKTKLFLFLMLFTMVSCQEFNDRERVLQNYVTVNGYRISILEYDSCEYLISGVSHAQMMTHKGNCKYCKIRNNKK